MNDLTSLLILVVLLALNAFFVGAEFALVSARRSQIEPRAAGGSWSARATLRGMENVSLSMACCQLGITMCSLGIGAVGEPAVAHLLEVPFEAMGVPSAFVHPVALVIALIIVVYLHMVLGEMVPKNITLAGPDRAALILGPPLYLVTIVSRPVIWLMGAGRRPAASGHLGDAGAQPAPGSGRGGLRWRRRGAGGRAGVARRRGP